MDEAGHPDATDLTRDHSPGNPDAMEILTLGLGLGLGRVLGLELGRQAGNPDAIDIHRR